MNTTRYLWIAVMIIMAMYVNTVQAGIITARDLMKPRMFPNASFGMVIGKALPPSQQLWVK